MARGRSWATPTMPPSSSPGARARDGRVIPQTQSGRREDMTPVDSDRPDRPGRQHPPATDQPGPRRTARPRHRRDPAPQHRQTTAYERHSTPNAASDPCRGSPAEHQTQGIFSAPQSGPGHGRARGRAAAVETNGHPAWTGPSSNCLPCPGTGVSLRTTAPWRSSRSHNNSGFWARRTRLRKLRQSAALPSSPQATALTTGGGPLLERVASGPADRNVVGGVEGDRGEVDGRCLAVRDSA